MQWDSSFFDIRDQFICTCRPSHDDIEPLRTILYDAEHLLVMGASEVWLIHFDVRSLAFGKGADTVQTAGTLFEHARVPIQIVVNDMPALQVKVNSLSHD